MGESSECCLEFVAKFIKWDFNVFGNVVSILAPGRGGGTEEWKGGRTDGEGQRWSPGVSVSERGQKRGAEGFDKVDIKTFAYR